MKRTNLAASRGVALIAVMLAAAGCETKASKERAAQLQTVSAEKDSLLAMMAENSKLMSEISNELAKVKDVKKPVGAARASESPLASSVSYRDSIRTKISDVVVRLTQAEARLATTQRRIRSMGAMSDSMKAQLTVAEQTMADLRSTLENQQQLMATMEAQVNDLKGQNTQLTVQNAALADTLHTAVSESNTVYYVIGTKDELKEKGIIEEQGSKFLFFGGKTLVPGWNLDPTVFTKADRRELAQIPLPTADQWYKIVSRQNVQYLTEQATKDGKVKGESLHITEPDRFWANSRFLIIVEG